MSANIYAHTKWICNQSGVLIPLSWIEAILNPSYLVRATHMIMACILSTSFVVMGISSYYFLARKHVVVATKSFIPALVLACIFSIAQIGMGDLVGINVLKYQPVKLLQWRGMADQAGPLILFAIPDQKNQTNHFEVKIPKLASLINTHSLDGVLPGLNEVPKSMQPPVISVFFTFRIMVGIGFLFVLVSWLSAYYTRKKVLLNKPWLLKILVLSIPLGFVATVWVDDK